MNSKGDVFAGGNRLMRSSDNGETWDTISYFNPTLFVITSNDNIISWDVLNSKIFTSNDNGETWKEIENMVVRANCVSEDKTGKIYVGSQASVYVSEDLGNNWTEINSGLPQSGFNSDYYEVNAIAIDQNNIPYIATHYGVYKLINTTNISVHEYAEEIPNKESFSLPQCYPNPFNDFISIRFNVPKTSLVTVNIFDVSGKLVKNIFNCQNYISGLHEIIWDGTNELGEKLPSGIYLLNIQFEKNQITRKLLFSNL